MRFVQLSVPAGKRTAILDILSEEDIDYVITDESSSNGGYEAVISFPLSQDDVEPTLDRLRESGISADAWTVVVDAQTVVSDRFEGDEKRDDDRDAPSGLIARDELRTAASDLAPGRSERWSYVVLTVVSAVVAVVGLLQNSAAVVVGSMVIAPLIGPAMAAATGMVIDDSDLATRGVALQVLGLGLAVVSAAAFAAVVRFVGLMPPGTDITAIPEAQSRLAPNFLSLAVALGAGIAGAISLTTGSGAALVGVMIAVALIPPAATVGLGIAWGQPLVSFGSGVLLLVNVLSINLIALVVIWLIGYRPQNSFQLNAVQAKIRQRIRMLAIALVVLSVFLAGVTYITYQSAQFEEQAENEVHDMIDEQPYRQLALVDLSIGSSETAIAFDEADVDSGGAINVSVTLNRPMGTTQPNFASDLDRRLTQQTERDVVVEAQFIDTGRTASERSSGNATGSSTLFTPPLESAAGGVSVSPFSADDRIDTQYLQEGQ
ncbi:TIGR00341 family protein (plasmid) [Natrinema zhouii]|uniref:TIGR00341 family protein n=1 Tax=Natrinema zhouii TaxID=1710539 RepID=UPI001CFFB754|nr:TIGR00341 family protein [Natrinema zhouii]UHQ98992.1 TIGR00341 family protein [Natrinema zhouii]